MEIAKVLRLAAGVLCLVPTLISVADVARAFASMDASIWLVGTILDLAAGAFLSISILVNSSKLSGAAAIVLAALQLLTCISVARSTAALIGFGEPADALGLLLVLAANSLLLLAFVAASVLLLTEAKPVSRSLRIVIALVAAVLCLLGTVIAAAASFASLISAAPLAVSALAYAVAFALLGVAAGAYGAPSLSPAAAASALAPCQHQSVSFCTHCGKPLGPGALFCTGCGASVHTQ